MEHPLDNPVWHAIAGPHSGFAVGTGRARQYPRDMAPFAAIAEATGEAYDDLGRDLPTGVEARLFRPVEEIPPPGWQVVSARPIRQLVADSAPKLHAADNELIALGPSDAIDMLALADDAKPGPFGPRTVEVGRFVGWRDAAGRLRAMAGERFLVQGHVELSAICVHPDVRGHGLGASMTRRLANDAIGRGEMPFLHVFPDNPAGALYERLGFRERATLWVLWHKPAP
jgi:ribosomal protein S18 acetylase RimI-like enzyme